jgi:hypothetical protein
MELYATSIHRKWKAYRQGQQHSSTNSSLLTQTHTLEPTNDPVATDDKQQGRSLILPDDALKM